MSGSDDESDAVNTDRNKSGAVGYGRPPVGKRFRPGQSGNPKGRPKGRENITTMINRILHEPVKIRDGNRIRSVSKIAAAIEVNLNKALSGDHRALWKIIEVAGKYNILDSSPEERFQAEVERADEFLRRELDRLAARSRESNIQSDETDTDL
jgi:hypothetical protein